MDGQIVPNTQTMIPLKFNGGVVSARDPALLANGQFADAHNIILDNQNMPQKIGNQTVYNATAMGGVGKGHISFLAEDGNEYTIVACNGYLWWTAGSGAMTKVKFLNAAVPVSINTSTYFFSFQIYDATISGNSIKIVYCTSNYYPIALNSNIAGTIPNAQYSRALRLQVNAGTIIAVNVYGSEGGATPGTDEVLVGTSSGSTYTSFPKGAVAMIKIFDRLIAIGTDDLLNGYYVSVAQCSADAQGAVGLGQQAWTGVLPDPTAMVGGGKYPETFIGGITYNSSFLLFSRNTVLRVDCAPGPFANWRETFIPTNLGAICNQSIVLHSDGWVYYVSTYGLCRTNGQIAERVDWDIQDDLQSLTQLQNNSYNIVLASTSVFNAGTPSNGDNLLYTIGLLSQLPLNTATQWNACSLTQLDTSTVPNGVQLGGGAILSPGFESGFTGWTKLDNGYPGGNPWALSSTGVHSGSYDAECPITFGYVNCVVLTSTNEIIYTTANLSYVGNWTQVTIPQSALAGYEGQNLYLQFTSFEGVYYGSIRSSLFLYTGNNITFWYNFRDTGGGSWNVCIDDIYIQYFSTGNLITPSFDFGTTPTTYGNLTAYVFCPTISDNIQFLYATSLDNITFSAYTSLGTASTSGNVTFSIGGTPARYIKIQAILNGSGNDTPILLNLGIGAQWISAVQNLNLIPATWETFVSNEVLNSGSITYEMNTSSNGSSWDGWVAVSNGAVPTNPLKQYVQFRLTFNTTNYADIPYTTGIALNYATSSGATIMPCGFSYMDRLYYSFMANGQTYNNYMWIGQTKPVAQLEYEVSRYTGYPYPIFTKVDFMGAMSFSLFHQEVFIMDGAGQLHYLSTGVTTNACTATSYFLSKAIGLPDCVSSFDFCYLYGSGNTTFNLYYRTKTSIGSGASKAWSAWSSAIVLQPDANIGRVVPLINGQPQSTPKITIPGLQTGDFMQFKIEQTNQDNIWAVSELHLYLTPQSPT